MESTKLIKDKARETDSALRALADEDNYASKAKEDYQKMVQQFAELRLNGAPKQVIMDALGLTEDDYSKLASREEVKEAVAQSEISRAKTSQVFDTNWDTVEDLALKAVAMELQINPDPDYALRAAAVANKAVRRRREDMLVAAKAGQIYQQVNTNNIAILNLPKVFMQQLAVETPQSATKQIELQRESTSIQKMHDSVDVSIVKDAFGFTDVSKLVNNQPAKLIEDASDSVKDDEIEEWLNG